MSDFRLISYSDPNIKRLPGTVSRIRFSRILFDEKHKIGIVVVTTADNIKSGKTRVVFVEKRGNHWSIAAERDVEWW